MAVTREARDQVQASAVDARSRPRRLARWTDGAGHAAHVHVGASHENACGCAGCHAGQCARRRGPPATQARWTAPTRCAAASTAASRAAVVSSTVRVRSGARKRRAKASDRLPSTDLLAGVDIEQANATPATGPAPARSAASTSVAATPLVDHECNVLGGNREVAQLRGRRLPRARIDQRVEVEFQCACARG